MRRLKSLKEAHSVQGCFESWAGSDEKTASWRLPSPSPLQLGPDYRQLRTKKIWQTTRYLTLIIHEVALNSGGYLPTREAAR